MPEPIVVLDGYTLNPGDLSWDSLEIFGDLTVYDRTPDDQIVARARDAPYVFTNKTPLSAETIDELPHLRYVGVMATGFDVVDVDAAKSRGIPVTNIPTYGTNSVSQHATALMLELVRHVGIHSEAVHRGEWSTSEDWCFALAPMIELTDKTLGVVGLGRIGLAFARIAAAMGMRVIAHDAVELTPAQLGGLPVQYTSLERLFREADVISLHCPLTAETDRLVNAERLRLMKPTAILLNTSRGPLVDSQALADALRAGQIAAAALDVLDTEPPPPDSPLIGAPRCIITPHISWYAKESRQRLLDIAVGNLKAFLDGTPVNVVNA